MNFSKSDIPFPVIQLIDTLYANQFEGWLVGGAIRTLMLNSIKGEAVASHGPQDWDVTTNATPEQVQKIFPHTLETGLAYGTVTVIIDSFQIQVTTFRKEGAYENHRKPGEVSYCKNLEEDLSRRDFTINAIAYNPSTDELRDPFEGQRDLEAQWIKAVGDPHLRFKEDALRILRAIRFQSQLGFFIESETLDAMEAASSLINTLSRERIQQEISKWLLGDHFSMTQVTTQKISLPKIFEVEPSSKFYEKWDQISAIEPTLLFRLCAFFDVYTGDKDTKTKHSNSLKLLKSLKYGQQVIFKVLQFIDFLSTPLDIDVPSERLHLIKRSLEIGFADALLLLNWKLQVTGHNRLFLKQKDHILKLQEQGFEKLVMPLAINGDQVMKILHLEPGPQIKVVLDDLQNWILENPNQNKTTILEEKLRKR